MEKKAKAEAKRVRRIARKQGGDTGNPAQHPGFESETADADVESETTDAREPGTPDASSSPWLLPANVYFSLRTSRLTNGIRHQYKAQMSTTLKPGSFCHLRFRFLICCGFSASNFEFSISWKRSAYRWADPETLIPVTLWSKSQDRKRVDDVLQETEAADSGSNAWSLPRLRRDQLFRRRSPSAMRGATSRREANEPHQARHEVRENGEAEKRRQNVAASLPEVQGLAACQEEGLRLRTSVCRTCAPFVERKRSIVIATLS